MINLQGLKFCITSLISVISCLFLRSQLFGGNIRDLWCKGGGDPVLLVSERGGGGNICGVLLSRARSRSGVLSTASSFTILSSSDDDSKNQQHPYSTSLRISQREINLHATDESKKSWNKSELLIRSSYQFTKQTATVHK